MNDQKKCFCKKRSLEFTSQFDGEVVTELFCPECVDRAPGDTVIFELCEPGEFTGTWGVRYNASELKRLDFAFRNDNEYFLSLMISGACGPTVARNYKLGGLCRIFGFKDHALGTDKAVSLHDSHGLPQAKPAAKKAAK